MPAHTEKQSKIRVFISSVQGELHNERKAARVLLSGDPALGPHCVPVTYEDEPASSAKALQECVALIDECRIFVLIVWKEQGNMLDDRSITHHEYLRAKALHNAGRMEILVFRKGARSLNRESGATALLDAVYADDFKYKEFEDYHELQQELSRSVSKILESKFGIELSTAEEQASLLTIEAASDFEQEHTDASWDDLDTNLARDLVAAADGVSRKSLDLTTLKKNLFTRGLLFQSGQGDYQATAAGLLLLGKKPSAFARYVHCQIQADAYAGSEVGPDTEDQANIDGPILKAIDEGIAFVMKNTRHPPRIVGSRRVVLDEYPREAIREALVNACVHRDYSIRSRPIILQVFSDRVVVASPGAPPAPLKIETLRRGTAKPCARNPIMAQCLFHLEFMEKRGSGFRRIQGWMEAAGLDRHRLREADGYLELVLPGPGDDLGRLKIPPSKLGAILPQKLTAQLNERQQKMAELLASGKTLTSRFCEDTFGVSRQTSSADFALLIKLKIATRIGDGRSTAYAFYDGK
jgi:ATP-dependent DNA helicase RecG